MPDQTLGIILQASASGAAAYDQMIAKNEELKTSAGNLNVIYGAQGQVLSDLSAKMDGASAAHGKVSGKAKEVATAERDLTKEGNEAARAMGELGAKGSEVFDRFSALGGVMGSGGALGVGIGAALVGIGGLIEGSKKVSETYQEQTVSIAGLRQAADATHQSFEDLSRTFEDWAQQNAQFIPNINTARDDLAAFTRAGFDAKTSMEAENAAVDLAALKHEDLATAGNQVLQMMEGQGRVAKQLGIDIAALKNSDDNAATAQKDFAKATDAVAKAQDALSKAERSLQEEEDALHGKRQVSKHDLDVLQDKQNAVKKAQDDLAKATSDQTKAQDAANNSTKTSQQVLDQLSVKLDNGRKNYSDLEKQQHINSAMWDDFSSRSGPAVNTMFQIWEGTLGGLIELLDDAAKGIQALGNATSHITELPAVGAAGGGPRGGFARINPGRQSGGPVYPGGVYTVGEAGPETLYMGAGGGYVAPNSGGESGSMDETNELLGQVVSLLASVATNTKGPPFSTAAWRR